MQYVSKISLHIDVRERCCQKYNQLMKHVTHRQLAFCYGVSPDCGWSLQNRIYEIQLKIHQSQPNIYTL